MTVDALHRLLAVTAQADEALIDVAGRMRFNDVASVVITDGRYVAGILTERDLIKAVADGADLQEATVADYMTPHPAVITADADVIDAARVMARMGVAHLPLVDEEGFVGVVSIRDVVLDLTALVDR
jgi:CBS domain-containing protein